jgi:histidyl-tRNA synthetase
MDRLPGFRDFFPEPLPREDYWSAAARQHLFASWRETARRYGFQEYDGPPLEPLELFTLKSGEEIVGQLYHFEDKASRAVSLRPEMTPTLARLVAASARHYKKPIKWFAIPQLFRYERQQKGRLREHFQFNADLVGEPDPAADSEVIALLIDTLRDLGLTAEDVRVRLSSRGAWQEFFERHGGAPDRAYEFFQAIDKMERDAPEVSEAKLGALGISGEAVREFVGNAQPTEALAVILSQLEARGLREYVSVDYGVIRGLAYYTGTVFEAFDRKGEFRAIAGGGRYDNLVKLISGGKVDLPALGFGMGDVVLTELLRARGRIPALTARVDAVCLIEDESRRADSLRLVQVLRESGRAVEYPLVPAKADKQFKRAQELNAECVVRVESPAQPGQPPRVWLKHLSQRSEQTLTWEEAVRWARGESPSS